MTNIDLSDLPVWLQPIELDQWQTKDVEISDLNVQLRLHQDWRLANTIQPSNDLMAYEAHYRGKQPAEWCIIHHLTNAQADHDMKEWVEAPIKLTSFPIVAMNVAFDSPARVMEMSYWGDYEAYMQHVSCEAMIAYDGIMQLPSPIGGVAHFYIVVMRRGNHAWKIELAFHSACLPGTDDETLNRNDHVRAGATLGYVKLT